MIAKCLAAVLLAVFAPAAPAAPAAAQRSTDPNCSDDRGVDRCSEEQQRRTRQLYGVRSIEEHRAAADEVRRIFYVDGYGHDVVMIAFVRAPGRDPIVSVHHPEQEGEARSEPIVAPVPLAVWNDVIVRSRDFHQNFEEQAARRASADDGTITLCLHGSVYTMEAVDRPRLGTEPTVRRKTENSCEDGPGELYAQELVRIARALFPHCAALDIARYRTEASALATCRILAGDRLAAAEALNHARIFTDVAGPQDASLISHLFEYEATIDWGGEQHRGPGGAEAFWAARIPAGEGRALLYFNTVEGVNAERVRLTGILARDEPASTDDRNGYETASVEQIWTRVGDGEWEIESVTVGPWRPLPSN